MSDIVQAARYAASAEPVKKHLTVGNGISYTNGAVLIATRFPSRNEIAEAIAAGVDGTQLWDEDQDYVDEMLEGADTVLALITEKIRQP